MKVKELIDVLLEMCPEAAEYEVVMSSDAEGNKISPLDGTSGVVYMPNNSWRGELREFDEDNEDPNALCLWPIN
jgi:hypothetical protein